MKFLVRIISEHPLKTISLMSESEIFEPCSVRKLKWGEGVRAHGPPTPPPTPTTISYAPVGKVKK